MGAMEPRGFLITEHKTGRVIFTNRRPSPDDMQEYELTGEAIYTTEQLAEAVAAERERCAKVCRTIADKELSNANKSDGITALMCAEVIRSAAK